MFIVSDEILERLTCSQCKKYLSVKTIKVYPNRGIKCGRCSTDVDAGVTSLFGVLAEEALFRCVNRFEGCNQLLTYSDVAEHEMSCIGKEYECPCCIESFKGTGYEIYTHFTEQHTEQLLVNTPEFFLETDNDLVKSYLYRKNDLLFYINAKFNRGEEELTLNVMYFGTDQDSSKISQMFSLHTLDGKLKYKSRRKNCCSVIGGNLKCFKIKITLKDFYKDVVICRFVIDTENVENLVSLPGNFKKCKQDLEDKKEKASNVIKPSIFGNGEYPVTIFNPTLSERIRGFKPASTCVSATSSTQFFSTPIGSVSLRQPATTTTVTSSIFGKSGAASSQSATGFDPASTCESATSSTQFFSTPITTFSLRQPATTTTVTSSIFGKSGAANSQPAIDRLGLDNNGRITTKVSFPIVGKPTTSSSSTRRRVIPTRFDAAFPLLPTTEPSSGKPSASEGVRVPSPLTSFDAALAFLSTTGPSSGKPSASKGGRVPNPPFATFQPFQLPSPPTFTFNKPSTPNGSNNNIFGNNQFAFGTPRTTGN